MVSSWIRRLTAILLRVCVKKSEKENGGMSSKTCLRFFTLNNKLEKGEQLMTSNHSEQSPGHNKTTMIIINGRQREVTGKEITYSQVVQMAFPDDQNSETIEYTVAYANPHGQDGTLVNGQTVHIKEGMVFNVTKTNRS
ncbi:MAG: hypothetical protein CVU71_14835 [Deltaproteobacteria bacterium HGW-Deltaproteobacteria-6]|nr:MAG: hypothetical protein CVU71_14835 [Deltaproteobacteria bacterium HGW-Deltaproteobacteria-6]